MSKSTASQQVDEASVPTASRAPGKPSAVPGAKAVVAALVVATLPLLVPAVLAQSSRISDGTVLGKPIDLVSADHQGKTDIGANIAGEWFDRKGVDMITDLTFSNVALAVENVAKDRKRLTLITGAGSLAITNEQCSPYNVHWMYDTYALANGTATALLAQGLKTWYFITADYAFGHALEKDARAVVTANGGQVVGGVRHPNNSPDQSSYLLQAQQSKAQVIAYWPMPASTRCAPSRPQPSSASAAAVARRWRRCCR